MRPVIVVAMISILVIVVLIDFSSQASKKHTEAARAVNKKFDDTK
jgi:hypothetical protein